MDYAELLLECDKKTQRIAELEARLAEAKSIFKEADEYLNTNELTNIGHGSILHRKFQEQAKEVKR